ncbi:MAG: DUF427 domain-containing protein [Ferrovibrio sp.]|uniref:DUF427 domain-containing protein n=1 Tax=Ferrovibrio sp. TaxID=1917215 RepID=UPI003918FD7E
MKLPGPDHPIAITPFAGRVRVTFSGQVVAETTRALRLQEASYPPVFYIPREDAAMALYRRSEHVTHCPYKGDASYYTLDAGGQQSANAVWSYEQPYPAMTQIAGHLAFYPDRVDAIQATES